MAAAKRNLFKFFRVSHKLALLSGGLLFVLGASGTAALVFAPAKVIPGYETESRGHCKTVYQSEFRRGKEKRLIAIISGDDIEPMDRVKTGVRVARHLAETIGPDLVIVQVADHRGPTSRAELRGTAIGAEIVHAPHPTRTLAVSQEWEVRYVDSKPTSAGYYFGPRADLPMPVIEALGHEIEMVSGCDQDLVAEAPQAEAASGGGHGQPVQPVGH